MGGGQVEYGEKSRYGRIFPRNNKNDAVFTMLRYLEVHGKYELVS